jgi:hypothetical protein
MQLENNNRKYGSKLWGRLYNMNNEYLLESFCFLGLTIGGIMEQFNDYKTFSIINVLKNPFFIGAAVMCVASALKFFKTSDTKIDYTYPAMYFFIFTKIIAQYFHSSHINLDGSFKKHHIE